MLSELLSQVNLRNTAFACPNIKELINEARSVISKQNGQRRTVSTAVLLAIFFNTCPDKKVLLSIISRQHDPTVHPRNLQTWLDNVHVLVQLEQSFPGCVPCGIDAFLVAGFVNLTQDQKLNALESIKERVTRDTIGEAMKLLDVINKPRPPFAGVLKLYHDVRAADGTLLTEMRDGDQYVNMHMILTLSRTTVRDYMSRKPNADYCSSLLIADQPFKAVKEVPQHDKSGSVWSHSKILLHAAKWGGSKYLAELECLLPIGLPTVELKRVATPASRDAAEEAFQDLPGEHKGRRRRSDGFVNATRLAVGFNTTWSQFSSMAGPQRVIAELQARTKGPVIIKEQYATWIHPELAAFMAESCKPGCGLSEELAKQFMPTHVIQPIVDACGQTVTYRRTSDGFVETTELAHYASRIMSKKIDFKDFLRRKDADDLSHVLGEDSVQRRSETSDGTWANEELAILFAKVFKLDVPFLNRPDPVIEDQATDTRNEDTSAEDSDTDDGEDMPSDDGSTDSGGPAVTMRIDQDDIVIHYAVSGETWTMRHFVDANGNMQVSVMDLIDTVTKRRRHALSTLQRIQCQYPDLVHLITFHQFNGHGQKPTLVVDAVGAAIIVENLTGRVAAHFRMHQFGALKALLAGGGQETVVSAVDAALANVVQPDVGARNEMDAPAPYRSMALGSHELPPNGIYVAMIATTKDYVRFRAGKSKDLHQRRTQHKAIYKRFDVVMTIMCGIADPDGLEKSMISFYEPDRVPIRINGINHNEIFERPNTAEDYLERMMRYIMDRHDEITVVRFQGDLIYEKATGDSEAVKLAKANAEAEKAKVQQLQLQLKLEMLRLGKSID